MIQCDKCLHQAIIYQRYSGMHLCREHFEADVNRKIREAIRKTGLFGRGARVAVGLDGGRNSATLAYVLKNLFIRRRDIDLLAIVMDDGGRLSPTSKEACLVAERLGMTTVIKSLPHLQDEASVQSCFSRHRQLFYAAAEDCEASIIATGEDLDDEALEIFVRYLQGDLEGCEGDCEARGEECAAGLPWIKPLSRVPKKEVRLYAIGRNLGCGIGARPCADALHREAKRRLSDFDCRHPGTNYSLLRGWERGLSPEGPARAKPLSKDVK